MKILGIETSHDDTSIAVLEDGYVLAMVTFSQYDVHKKYGGVVPELASREHSSNIALVLEEIRSQVELNDIDYIAYTKEPGLIGALHMGSLAAHAISFALNKPLIPVNHLMGHVYSVAIGHEIIYPMLSVIASGGHTQIVLSKFPLDFTIVGETRDDAIGEAYDKIARKLELGFPGGPAIDKIAIDNPKLSFTIPMQDNSLNMSFSGLKSSVISYIHNILQQGGKLDVIEIGSAFQNAAIAQIINKTKIAIMKYKPKTISLCGGVSANSKLRSKFMNLTGNTIIPKRKYCTDNGAMIAMCAQVMQELK